MRDRAAVPAGRRKLLVMAAANNPMIAPEAPTETSVGILLLSMPGSTECPDHEEGQEPQTPHKPFQEGASHEESYTVLTWIRSLCGVVRVAQIAHAGSLAALRLPVEQVGGSVPLGGPG